MIFHYVLFADRTTAARAAATGPDEVPPGTRHAPSPADVAASAAASDAAPAANSAAEAARPLPPRGARRDRQANRPPAQSRRREREPLRSGNQASGR